MTAKTKKEHLIEYPYVLISKNENYGIRAKRVRTKGWKNSLFAGGGTSLMELENGKRVQLTQGEYKRDDKGRIKRKVYYKGQELANLCVETLKEHGGILTKDEILSKISKNAGVAESRKSFNLSFRKGVYQERSKDGHILGYSYQEEIQETGETDYLFIYLRKGKKKGERCRRVAIFPEKKSVLVEFEVDKKQSNWIKEDSIALVEED